MNAAIPSRPRRHERERVEGVAFRDVAASASRWIPSTFHSVALAAAVSATIALSLGLAPALLAQRTFEQDVRPGRVTPPVSGSGEVQFDAAPAPMHPASSNRPPPPPDPPSLQALISGFMKAYAAAGSPRVAILYNRTFAHDIAAWTTDARATLHLPAATAARAGFGAENLQWSFEEGFLKPFLAAGVRVVDSSLIIQASNRNQKSSRHLQAAEINASELNANIEALRQHTDWLIEVLMLADAKSEAGYLFRTSLKRLSDGRVLASGVSTLGEFRAAPPSTKVVYDDTGYKFVSDEAPKRTLDDYAQSVAVRLLVDLAARLPALAKP